jgi:hypothetical protein
MVYTVPYARVHRFGRHMPLEILSIEFVYMYMCDTVSIGRHVNSPSQRIVGKRARVRPLCNDMSAVHTRVKDRTRATSVVMPPSSPDRAVGVTHHAAPAAQCLQGPSSPQGL